MIEVHQSINLLAAVTNSTDTAFVAVIDCRIQAGELNIDPSTHRRSTSIVVAASVTPDQPSTTNQTMPITTITTDSQSERISALVSEQHQHQLFHSTSQLQVAPIPTSYISLGSNCFMYRPPNVQPDQSQRYGERKVMMSHVWPIMPTSVHTHHSNADEMTTFRRA